MAKHDICPQDPHDESWRQYIEDRSDLCEVWGKKFTRRRAFGPQVLGENGFGCRGWGRQFVGVQIQGCLEEFGGGFEGLENKTVSPRLMFKGQLESQLHFVLLTTESEAVWSFRGSECLVAPGTHLI